MNFWKNKNEGVIDPDLFSKIADEWAKKVCDKQNSQCNKISQISQCNKISQIRKFYDEVLRFKDISKNEIEFQKSLPYIRMLKAKVQYALGRGLVSEEFKHFINESIDAVKDKDDFEVFATLFEAFMGYYKYYDEKRNQGRNR
jgi:CRISPR-associated protein Csm2